MDYSRIRLEDVALQRPDLIDEIKQEMETEKIAFKTDEAKTLLKLGQDWFRKPIKGIVKTKVKRESSKAQGKIAAAKAAFLRACGR